MAFNSNTYRSNKYRREAWDWLARAREAKARGEADRVANLAFLARNSLRIARSYKRTAELFRRIR